MRVLIYILTVFFIGCGGCPQVSQHRSDFLNQQGATVDGGRPHILLEVSRELIDSTLDKVLGKLPKVSARLSGLGEVGKYLGRLSIKARDLKMELDRLKSARIELELDIQYRSKRLFGMVLEASAPVKYTSKTGVMEIIVRHDLFKKIEPKIGNGAIDKLTASLRREIPGIARSLFPKSMVRKYARRGIKRLSRDLYGLIRKEMLTPMGEMTRFRFTLPRLPLRKMSVRSNKNGWQISAFTTIPARGLRPSKVALKGKRMRFGVSTHFLARLGNWAMDNGDIPSMYDRKGRPQKSGEFVAGFAWQTGARPLKVNLWTANTDTLNTCIHIRTGATPVVKLKGKKLKVGFKNGKIEETLGPPFFKTALSVLGISKRVFSFTKTIALQNQVRLGSRKVGVTVRSAQFDGDALRFDLDLGSRKKSRKKKRKKKRRRTS